jgi:hypothetical protein
MPVLVGADPLPSSPHIYVEGSAEIRAEPDILAVAVSLDAQAKTLAEAKESVDRRSRALLDACRDLTIAPADVTTTTLQIGPAYEYSADGSHRLVGTSVHREVEITLRDLSKYPELIAALVSADISSTLQTTLKRSDAESLLDEALLKALADARARAARLAEAANMKLGPVHSISEFELRQEESWKLNPSRDIGPALGSPTVAAYSRAMSAGEPFEPGLLIASAKIYVVYLLSEE